MFDARLWRSTTSATSTIFLEQPDKALEQFTQALSILRSIGDLRSAASSLEGIARAEQKRGNLADARKYIEESLTLERNGPFSFRQSAIARFLPRDSWSRRTSFISIC